MKKIEHYDFSVRPKKAGRGWMFLARVLAIDPRLRGRKITVRKMGMDEIRPPYFLLATHASMLDFPLMYRAIAPYYSANNVVAIDAVRDVGDYLMRRLGCITKRKFIKDYSLIRNMRYCAEKYKSIVCVYPEARYSLDGTTSYIPPSVAKMSKLMKVPLVVLRMYGTFFSAPQWNKPEQKLPLCAELECVATAEEVASLSSEELYGRILKAMARDDYAYQKEQGIKNPDPRRAEGLHMLLYRCPHCGTEFEMYSGGTRLWCARCGKAWRMTEDSELEAEEGETEFSHIPDWSKWERETVRKEVREGTYRFESEVTVHTLPNAKRFYDQGKGVLRQTEEGTFLSCTAYGERKELFWSAAELESVHIEYDYPFRKKKYKKNIFGDCIDLSVPDDSFWLHPVGLRDRLTKFSFATEEIHFLALERLRGEGKGKNAPSEGEKQS